MAKLISFCILLLLIFNLKADDNPDVKVCRTIPKLDNFQSKLLYRYHFVDYHIEEFRFKDKGKLIIYNNNRDEHKEIYYQNHNKTETRFAFYDKIKNTCEFKVKDHNDIEQIDVVPPFKFFDLRTGLYGPSALVSIIENNFLDKFKPAKPKPFEVKPRGIDIKVCHGQFYLSKKEEMDICRLSFSDAEWNVFDQKENQPQLIRVNYISDAHIDPADKKRIFDCDFQYVFFKSIDEKSEEEFKMHEFDFHEKHWILPSLCESTEKITPKLNIPKQFKVKIDKTDQISERKMTSYDIVVDKKNDLYRFETYHFNGQITTKLFKNEDKFFLEHDGDKCTYYFGSKLLTEQDHYLKNLIKVLFSLEYAEFDYVGKQDVRGILTNVYRHRKLDNDILRVQSIFIEERASDTNNEEVTHDPIEIKDEVFEIKGGLGELVDSITYHFYDFEMLKNDDELIEEMKIPKCEGQSLKEFNLVIKHDFTDEEILKFDENAFKYGIRDMITKLHDDKPINVPKIELTIDKKEIIIFIRYIDYISPILYFEIAENNKIAFGEKKGDEIIHKDRDNVVKCGEESLKTSNSIGFQFCPDLNGDRYCHIIIKPDGWNHKHGKITVFEKNINICKVYQKAFLSDPKFYKYVVFDEKIKKITELVNQKKFIYKNNEKEFLVERIHIIEEESEIDRSKLFELKLKGEKFNEKSIKKTIKYEDGILNAANCYTHCTNPLNDYACDSFAFCRRPDNNYNCLLGNLQSEEGANNNNKKQLEENENCDLYMISSLNHFLEHSHKKLISKDQSEIISTFKETKSSDCALNCLNHNSDNAKNDKDRCLSIEVCGTEKGKETCRLTKKHSLWKNDKIMTDNDNCNVYSVRHILNFHVKERSGLQDYFEEKVDSLDHCSTLCDLKGDCDRFNYCESNGDKKCHYVSKSSKGSKNHELESELLGCTSYIHRNKLIGAPQFDDIEQKKQFIYKKNNLGYKKSSSIGLILLALFIGLAIGASIIGFISRSKITIRRQGTEQESGTENAQSAENNLEHLAPVLPRSSGSINLPTANTVYISNTTANPKKSEEFRPFNWGLDSIKDDQL